MKKLINLVLLFVLPVMVFAQSEIKTNFREGVQIGDAAEPLTLKELKALVMGDDTHLDKRIPREEFEKELLDSYRYYLVQLGIVEKGKESSITYDAVKAAVRRADKKIVFKDTLRVAIAVLDADGKFLRTEYEERLAYDDEIGKEAFLPLHIPLTDGSVVKLPGLSDYCANNTNKKIVMGSDEEEPIVVEPEPVIDTTYKTIDEAFGDDSAESKSGPAVAEANNEGVTINNYGGGSSAYSDPGMGWGYGYSAGGGWGAGFYAQAGVGWGGWRNMGGWYYWPNAGVSYYPQTGQYSCGGNTTPDINVIVEIVNENINVNENNPTITNTLEVEQIFLADLLPDPDPNPDPDGNPTNPPNGGDGGGPIEPPNGDGDGDPNNPQNRMARDGNRTLQSSESFASARQKLLQKHADKVGVERSISKQDVQTQTLADARTTARTSTNRFELADARTRSTAHTTRTRYTTSRTISKDDIVRGNFSDRSTTATVRTTKPSSVRTRPANVNSRTTTKPSSVRTRPANVNSRTTTKPSSVRTRPANVNSRTTTKPSSVRTRPGSGRSQASRGVQKPRASKGAKLNTRPAPRTAPKRAPGR